MDKENMTLDREDWNSMLDNELNIPEDKICLNCEWGIENGARDKYWCICPEQKRSNKEP